MRFIKLPNGKGDPKPLYAMLFAGILVVVMAITTLNASGDVRALEDAHADLSSDLAGLDRTIAEAQAGQDAAQTQAVMKATGLDPALIATDTVAAEGYFAPAFNWTSGAAYDDARVKYEESLGADNSFTTTYFPENIKIETNSGDLSLIDHKKLKSSKQDIVIVPTSQADSRIRYVAFVTYYMHTDPSDLANLDALVPSTAIIEFTASGEASERRVSEVEAWAGFAATLEN